MRVVGVLREIAFASAFGAGAEADALNAALRVPNLFRDVFAEGAFAHAFVPAFARAGVAQGAAGAYRLLNGVLVALLVCTGLVVASAIAWPSPWVWLVASGFGEEKRDLAEMLVRAASPLLIGLALSSALGAVLVVRGRTITAVLAPGAVSALVLAACLLPSSAWVAIGVAPIVAVAAASSVGALIAVLVQLPAAWAEGWRPAVVGPRRELVDLARLVAPALAGVAAVQAGILVDLQLAARLGDGAVSHVQYALRLVQMPMHLFAGSVAAVAIGGSAVAIAAGRMQIARAVTASSVGLVAWLVAPIAVALLLFHGELVALMFERGAFDAADTAAVGAIVACYSAGCVAMALHRLLVPLMFAWGDARSPFVVSVLGLVLRVPIALWLATPERLDVLGIALSHVIAATLEVGVLLVILGRHATGIGRPLIGDLARTLVGTLVMAGTCVVASPMPWPVALAIGVVVFVSVTTLAGASHLRELVARAAPSGLPPHVDAATARAILACEGAELLDHGPDGQGWCVVTSRGTLRLTAEGGVLVARLDDARSAGASVGVVHLVAVLDTTRVPPPLVSIELGDGLELSVREDRVERGVTEGARIDLGAARLGP